MTVFCPIVTHITCIMKCNLFLFVQAPDNLRVRVDVDVFHLPVVESNHRCYHWMEVRYNLVGQTGIR